MARGLKARAFALAPRHTGHAGFVRRNGQALGIDLDVGLHVSHRVRHLGAALLWVVLDPERPALVEALETAHHLVRESERVTCFGPLHPLV